MQDQADSSNISFLQRVTMRVFNGENSNLSLSVPARRWPDKYRRMSNPWHCPLPTHPMPAMPSGTCPLPLPNSIANFNCLLTLPYAWYLRCPVEFSMSIVLVEAAFSPHCLQTNVMHFCCFPVVEHDASCNLQNALALGLSQSTLGLSA